MAITTLLDPALLPARTMDQAAFDDAMAYLMANLPTWGAQTNALQANLNSIAAGGAYALAYKWGSTVNASIGFTPGGFVTFGNGVDNNIVVAPASATVLFLDTKDAAGASTSSLLPSLTSGNTSTIKGHVRIVKLGDPSKWARFSVTGFNPNSSLYNSFYISFIDASGTTPFATSDSVLVYFQRTGDKGDTGAAGVTPGTYAAKVSHRIATSTAGDSVAGANTRALNTVESNTITGASLASNTLTLPAGTYRYRARAPGYGTGYHTCYLYNTTSSAIVNQGSTSYNGVSTDQSDSTVSGYFTLSAQSGIQLRHNFSNAVTSGLGLASNSIGSGINVYAELEVEKLS
jgi:hypothetical protein